jgi:hypothetical protein
MSVSISEVRDFLGSSDGIEDLGNVINLGDDLGASLLTNTKVAPAQESKAVSFDLGGSSANDIQILEPIDAVPLDINLGGDSFGGPSLPKEANGPSISVARDDSGWSTNLFSGPQTSTATTNSYITPSRDLEAEKQQKSDYITKLQRLEAKGYPISRRFTMDNSLDEMKTEYDRLVDARQLETSIKFQRQILTGLVTGVELMNEKFDPFDLQLKGWSESVHESLDDYDEIFEELYDKYKTKGSMPPEARLLFTLVGSGFMFHMTNKMFRTKEPTMDDILRNNPGLQRQFAAAAAAQMGGPGFGNFMNMAMPGQAAPPPMAPSMGPPMGAAGMFYESSRQPMPPQVPQNVMATEPPKPQRREMKGPSGVEDILKTFEEQRKLETEPMFNPFGAGTSIGGRAIPSSGTADIQQPAVNALDEIQTIMTEETTTESRRGGGRRRKAQPIGNTVSLDI